MKLPKIFGKYSYAHFDTMFGQITLDIKIFQIRFYFHKSPRDGKIRLFFKKCQ